MIKYLVLVAVVLISCSDDESEPINPPAPEPIGSWQQLDDFPFVSRDAISFSLLGKGYIASGANYNNMHLKDVWSYDPSTALWEQKNDYPFNFVVIASATANDKAYIADITGKLYEYDPLPDSWKHVSNFPDGNRPAFAAFGLGANVYFGTFTNVDPNNVNNFDKDFWKYDPLHDQWTQIEHFPGSNRSEAISFVINNIAYVGAGFHESAPPFFKDFYSFDATTGKWKQIADIPENNILTGISFSSDTKGYVGLSENNDARLGKIFEYNPIHNSWREIQKFPSRYSLLTNSFTVNNRMFVVGGWMSEYSNQVWEFKP